MRVCHLITRMIVGGAQENTLYNCQDLIEHYGDEVLLVTGPSLGPEGSLLEQGRGVAVPTEVIPSLRRSIHPWHDLLAYRAIKKTLARFRPDVVHTHSAKAGILGRFAAWSLGIPAIVHTVHGAPFYPSQSIFTRTFYQWCERAAARRCHALISVADAMTDLMVEARIAPREKFTTISSGMEVEPLLAADEHRARRRAELGIAPSDVVIGKIARLFELKGHDDVIAAAKLVVRECPQAKFMFVGDGLLRSQLEKQIAESGLTNHFIFTGLVSPKVIPEQIAAMDLLVHASLREGLARALPQALIAGRPVVSYDIDGAREVTIDGETGYLLPPRDVTGLALAITKLVESPALRQQLGGQGRARFADQFRHETMTREIRQLYEQCLAKSSS